MATTTWRLRWRPRLWLLIFARDAYIAGVLWGLLPVHVGQVRVVDRLIEAVDMAREVRP